MRSLYLLSLLIVFACTAVAAGTHPSNENCLDCHFEPQDDYQVHLSSGDDCAFCHDGIRSSSGYAITTISDNEMCIFCHSDQGSSLTMVGHADQLCVDCHSAHGAEAAPRLKSEVVALCSKSCHTDGKIGLSHPVGPGIVDSYIGAEMTCTSTCHSVHSPAQPKLLQTESQALCRRCHSDLF